MRQQYTANEMFMGQKKLWSIFLIPPSLSNMVVVLDCSAVKKSAKHFLSSQEKSLLHNLISVSELAMGAATLFN